MTNPDNSGAAARLADAGIYSDLSEINARLMEILPDLPKKGFVFRDAKPIPYGTRITVESESREISCNLYFSRKKGFSCVIDKKAPSTLADALHSILLKQSGNTAISSIAEECEFTCWIGSDEAGKGDYLGPLVVGSFLMTRDLVAPLRKLGVKDSKNLTNDKVRSIARTLFMNYKNRVSVVELTPDTYNRLYEQFRSQGKKLNELLAWAHGKAISDLVTPKVDAVIVDRFAADRTVMKNMDRSWRIISRPRAEDNIAVAAASILARARYLFRLDKLSDQFGIKLSPGAGDNTLTAVRNILTKHGSDTLRHVAKLHFKNTQKAGALFHDTDA